MSIKYEFVNDLEFYEDLIPRTWDLLTRNPNLSEEQMHTHMEDAIKNLAFLGIIRITG